jgi:hypothetical protein
MIQTQAQNRKLGFPALAMAVLGTALMALAAIGGYAIGSARPHSESLVVQRSAEQPSLVAPATDGRLQEPLPDGGLQP